MALAMALAAVLAWGQPGRPDPVQERLRHRLEAAGDPPVLAVGETAIHAARTLVAFYEARAYRPAWADQSGPLPAAQEVLASVAGAHLEGLRPDDYHHAELSRRLRPAGGAPPLDSPARVDLELLLTDAFLLYGADSLAGHLDPETIDPEWVARRRGADMAVELQAALEGDRVGARLAELLPPQEGYALLRRALAQHREISQAGGWPQVPAGPTVKPGDEDARVPVLRARLRATGDLEPGAGDDEGSRLGEVTRQGVIRFQERHGLDPDGKVGPATLAALNVTAGERVDQIRVNMERWRWLPQELGARYVLVNIADFHLDLVENGEPVLAMRVIVGKDYRRTPVFSDQIRYLVLNPAWEVPNQLAVQDILPEVRRNPDYLSQMGIKVLQGWGAGERELDPSSIDWRSVSPRQFSYRFRQAPGPQNALGTVKFMFPNRFNIYLHDTPKRELFRRAERSFSSGCIRVEKPMELSERLLWGDSRWNREAITAAVRQGTERTVRLPEPVAVHLLYWTAWVDEEGRIQFRRDLYGRDGRVLEALAQPAPGPRERGTT